MALRRRVTTAFSPLRHHADRGASGKYRPAPLGVVATDHWASRDDGRYVIDNIETEAAYTKVNEFAVQRDDPCQAVSQVACTHEFNRGDWRPRIEAEIIMRADQTHFHMTARIVAIDDRVPFFERVFEQSFPRDHQ